MSITAEIKNDHHEDYIYVFEPQALNAIKAAVLINRPLLVKGKPGSGKSQLAKAAASYLDRTFISHVVSAKTEAQNLLWSFDAVARLADAQIEGALCKEPSEKDEIRDKLALKNYIKPEALWAALNWSSAETQYKALAKRAGQDPDSEGFKSPLTNYHNYEQALKKGVVVLIDEIDKADSSLPNGLLEVLGSNRFQPDGMNEPVELTCTAAGTNKSQSDDSQESDTKEGDRADLPKPLIIITTNDEHPLPDAFIRRCLEVKVGLPEDKPEQWKDYLVSHAKPNFTALANIKMDDDTESGQNVLEAVAEQVIKDRQAAQASGVKPLVGQAEYFDILRGLDALLSQPNQQNSEQNIWEWITELACFSSQKGQSSASNEYALPAMGIEKDAR